MQMRRKPSLAMDTNTCTSGCMSLLSMKILNAKKPSCTLFAWASYKTAIFFLPSFITIAVIKIRYKKIHSLCDFKIYF